MHELQKSSIVVLGMLALLLSFSNVHAASEFDWMQDGAETKKGFDFRGGKMPTIRYTKIPKKTATKKDFTKKYILELEKFNIKNDGTDPENTSNGINQALQHATAVRANYIIFPKGTYLISETIPIIFNHKNTIVDLNGATLQMNANDLQKSCIAKIADGAEHFRLTNGTLKGDRDQHPGKGEWACGLIFDGGVHLEIDHIKMCNVPGYGFSSRTGFAKGTSFDWINANQLEQGAFSKSGAKIENPQKLRSAKMYDLSTWGGAFEFGYTFGYQCYPSIKARAFQGYFYDKNKKIVCKKDLLQFRKTDIPKKANYVSLEFNQATAKNGSEGAIGRFTNLRPPREVHMHHNHFYNNRTLGMAFCGGQKWIIENNLFVKNGGNAPGYGIDFEDGWDLMQDVIVRKNTFKKNVAGDLVACGGTELLFEKNVFENRVHFSDRVQNYTVQDNDFNGKSVGFRTGLSQGTIRNNRYSEVSLEMKWNEGKTAGVPLVVFENETLENMKGIVGTALKFINCRISNSTIWAIKDMRLLHFEKCTLSNVTVRYNTPGEKIKVILKNCKGELKEHGALDRKVQ